MDMIIIWLIVGLEFLMMGGVLVWYYLQDRTKSLFYYFDTENTARVMKRDVKDGSVIIPNKKETPKTFILDKTKPKLTKTFFGWKPTYYLKWNSALPMEIDLEEGKLKKSALTPENITNLLEMKAIDKLLSPKQEKFNMILFLAMGVVVGILAGISIMQFVK